MKKKTKLFLIIFLSSLLFFSSLIIASGVYLDLTINHKYSKSGDNPRPESITIIKIIECDGFIAKRIMIGKDKYWFITDKNSRRNTCIYQEGIGWIY